MTNYKIINLIFFLLFLVQINNSFSFFDDHRAAAPGPLFSVSTNLAEARTLSLSQFSSYTYAEGDDQWKKFLLNYNQLAYSLKNDLCFILTIHYQFSKIFNKSLFELTRETGLLRVSPKIEFALYEKKKNDKDRFVFSLVTGVELPTLNLVKKVSFFDPISGKLILSNEVKSDQNPELGIILRAYADFLDPNWYSYVIGGITIGLEHQEIKAGNYFFCNFGFGPIIKNSHDANLTILTEFNIDFIGHNGRAGIINVNSGLEDIFAGVTAFYSYKNLAFQAGFQVPLLENLFDNQALNSKFRIGAYFSFTF